MEMPQHHYFEKHFRMLILGAEGTAPQIERMLDTYRVKGIFKRDLDISPVMKRTKTDNITPFYFAAANMYGNTPLSLQIGQDISKEERPYTTIVCTGIGDRIVRVMLDFERVSGFTVRELSEINRKAIMEDQFLFKVIYDGAISHGLSPESLFSASIRGQQATYR